jgi:BirA family biotin operon repressor/biotin-[acetyl-CoA-carboxylase] ligase
MNIDFIKRRLIGNKILEDIIYFEEIESTNAFAKDTDPPGDVMVLTSNQISGRGRFERKWGSEKDKDITLSIIKAFQIDVQNLHLVNFYTSYSVLQTLLKHCGESGNKFSLKWPNDVLLNGRKICGILTECSDIYSKYKKFIIGIGVNINHVVFDVEIRDKATSLFLEFGEKFVIEEIICELIEYFYENLNLINEKEKLIQLWKNYTQIIGKRALIKVFENSSEKMIKILDIDLDGGIKVEIENEEKFKYFSGDISVIETY